MIDQIKKICEDVSTLPLAEKVSAINEIRELIHNISPFKNEPVDFVKWVLSDMVIANEYNPNKVAPVKLIALLKTKKVNTLFLIGKLIVK